ncbi:MAG: molybdopterin biosynthesis protein [Methanotrichaceae archaeon]
MRKEFRTLLSLGDARSVVLDHLPQIELETLPPEVAFGRILGEKVVSMVDVPGFDRAAMDGYAVRSADILEAREDRAVALELVGQVPMGKTPNVSVSAGQAAEVSTGSMMPPGSDSVVMVEHAEEDDRSLLIRRSVHVSENVHKADSDIAFGETVLNPGTKLTAREIGVLAAVGRSKVKVRNLKVGLASTGNELVCPGEPLKPGQIYDINSYSIAAAVKECGGSPVICGILPDDRDLMAEGLMKMTKDCGLVLVSGSTSAGIGDMIYNVLDEIGETIFHGINLKPGKPTLFGSVSGKPFFGLPGYPTSSLTVFGQLVAPVIRKTLGTDNQILRTFGKLARPIRSEGRRQMFSVGIVGGWVYPVDKGSGSITSLSQADGVIEIPDDVEYLDRNEKVEVHLFGDFPEPALLITGEDCPALETLVEILPFSIRFVVSGTKRGTISVEDGIADLALVSKSPDFGQICDCDPSTMIRGYTRELVIMSKDPDLLDFANFPDHRVMGWSKYSEMSRIFQDVLKRNNISPVNFVGQARTHSAVAAAVAAGNVDLGFGSRAAAEKAGLAFSKVAEDEIDFLIGPQRMEREPVQKFLEALRSQRLKSMLPEGNKLHKDK